MPFWGGLGFKGLGSLNPNKDDIVYWGLYCGHFDLGSYHAANSMACSPRICPLPCAPRSAYTCFDVQERFQNNGLLANWLWV